jgi:hypothetical protein
MFTFVIGFVAGYLVAAIIVAYKAAKLRKSIDDLIEAKFNK